MTAMKIWAERLLLVEGKDEVNLFDKALDMLQYKERVQVIDVGSKHKNFTRKLRTIQEASRAEGLKLETIGVVRDADDSAISSFASVRDGVVNVGLRPPSRHGEFSDGEPSVGIFIVPDGEKGGAIETLCRRSLGRAASVGCVEAYIRCLRAEHAFSSRNEDKSFVHAYLAAMEDPMVRVGEAAQGGAWDFEAAAFEELIGFVRRLVELATQKGTSVAT